MGGRSIEIHVKGNFRGVISVVLTINHNGDFSEVFVDSKANTFSVACALAFTFIGFRENVLNILL